MARHVLSVLPAAATPNALLYGNRDRRVNPRVAPREHRRAAVLVRIVVRIAMRFLLTTRQAQAGRIL